MTAKTTSDAEPNDPTRSGPPLSQDAGACLSHNEVEQLCLKAARGAGMSWGLAEEAGFAAAWLSRRDMDGPGAMLAQLDHAQGRAWTDICPIVTSDGFHASTGQDLCPIALGTALCDHGALLGLPRDRSPVRVGPVSQPILLLPFLSDLARSCALNLRLVWPGGNVVVGQGGGFSGDVQTLGQARMLDAEICVTAGPVTDDRTRPKARLVRSETLEGLNDFALKTTVPASDASRAGAGADDE